jgi:UDP-arabinose 4-epimerase
MRVLVTGGAGYIGSHTAKLLARRGDTPVVLDDLSMGRRDAVRFGPFEQGDIRDEAFVFDVLRRHEIAAVVHFAAKAVVSESVRQAELYHSVNVGGMMSLVAAMGRAGVTRLVFSSSCAVYGSTSAERIPENHALAPISPYGLTKLQAERLMPALGSRFGLRWAVLRYFNVIGADPDGELAEHHEPETHLLPNLVRAAQTGAEFTLYGDRHATPDGTAVRDYVDVGDLALVHAEALEALERQPHLVSNVGTGRGISVREMVAAAERECGRKVRVRIEPQREGDAPRLVADDTYFRTWSALAQRGLTPLAESVRNVLRAAPAVPTR